MSEVRFVISISVHEVLCKDMDERSEMKRQFNTITEGFLMKNEYLCSD